MIVVTGGAGFLGTHLVQRLLDEGADVRVVEHPRASVEHLPRGPKLAVVRADIRDRAAVREAVVGATQVYHLAANPNLWTRDRRDFDAVNHRGTVHLLEESLAAGAERVLHCSTESILTSRHFTGGKVEELRLRAEDMVGPYCLSKFRAEEFALDRAAAGEPVVVVNPTLPVGPGDRGLSPPTRMTLAACRGKLPAYLDTRFNMIDARDVAEGMVRAMARGRPGRRYVLGHENLTLREWLRKVAAAVGRRPPRYAVPYWLALLVARVDEAWADTVTGRMPTATVTGVRLTRYCMHFDPSDTLSELGLVPRSLDESLADMITWFRQTAWLAGPLP